MALAPGPAAGSRSHANRLCRSCSFSSRSASSRRTLFAPSRPTMVAQTSRSASRSTVAASRSTTEMPGMTIRRRRISPSSAFDQGEPGGRLARDGQQPGRERLAVRPGQLLVAVGAVQEAELLVAGRAASGEHGEAVGGTPICSAMKASGSAGISSPGLSSRPGKRSAQSWSARPSLVSGCLRVATSWRSSGEGVVPDQVDLARGQRQQVGALRVGEEASAGHGRSRAGCRQPASGPDRSQTACQSTRIMSLVCERRSPSTRM